VPAGGGDVSTTLVVADNPEVGSVAVTWYVPGAVPAVKSPELLIVPPVADQVTLGEVVEPSLIVPVAWNCTEPPTCTDGAVGATLTLLSVGGGGGGGEDAVGAGADKPPVATENAS